MPAQEVIDDALNTYLERFISPVFKDVPFSRRYRTASVWTAAKLVRNVIEDRFDPTQENFAGNAMKVLEPGGKHTIDSMYAEMVFKCDAELSLMVWEACEKAHESMWAKNG